MPQEPLASYLPFITGYRVSGRVTEAPPEHQRQLEDWFLSGQGPRFPLTSDASENTSTHMINKTRGGAASSPPNRHQGQVSWKSGSTDSNSHTLFLLLHPDLAVYVSHKVPQWTGRVASDIMGPSSQGIVRRRKARLQVLGLCSLFLLVLPLHLP